MKLMCKKCGRVIGLHECIKGLCEQCKLKELLKQEREWNNENSNICKSKH